MYQKVMVPLDGSELAECVIPHVESLIKSGQAKQVVLVRVAESYDSLSWGQASAYMGDEEKKNFDVSHQKVAREYLDDIASRLASGGAPVEKMVLAGRASEELSDYAKKNKVDLVVISTHGRSGVSRWVMGSVADRLLRSTSAPVLMVRAPGCIPGM